MLKHILPIVLTGLIGACFIGDNEYDQTFTINSDVALSETFETVERADWTGAAYECYPKDVYFFSTAAEFETFYSALRGNVPSPPTPPTIDFMQYRVVAVVDEDQPSSGYSVEIISIELHSGDQYDVTAHFSEPVGGALMVMTKPYHIVKVEVLQ